MTSAISAQTEAEHLTFKGVPIDGTLSEYVAKMKNAGFRYIGAEDGTAILQGDFAGFKDCTIGVSTLKSLNIVNQIAVIFPARKDWSSLENNYEHLKSMLTQKYGDPADVVEKFQSKYVDSNDDKLIELMMDRCTWYTSYKTNNGKITLSILKTQTLQYHVVLLYYDKINTDTVRSAAIDDL